MPSKGQTDPRGMGWMTDRVPVFARAALPPAPGVEKTFWEQEMADLKAKLANLEERCTTLEQTIETIFVHRHC